MNYPRMSKEDYPELPKEIKSEDDYNLVLEYLIFASVKMEKVINEFKFPLQTEENKAKYKKQILAMDKRYKELCDMIDNYNRKGCLNE